MTINSATKKAIRERMAQTGEPYVLARRTVLDSMSQEQVTSVDTLGHHSPQLGDDLDGKPIIWDLSRFHHLLIVGKSGSGKTTALDGLMRELMLSAGIAVNRIDTKAPSFTMENLIVRLSETTQVIDERRSTEQISWTPEVFLIDEVYPVLGNYGDDRQALREEIGRLLTFIANYGGAVGFHLVIATQKVACIPTGMFPFLDARVALGWLPEDESNMVLDSDAATTLPVSPANDGAGLILTGRDLRDVKIVHQPTAD